MHGEQRYLLRMLGGIEYSSMHQESQKRKMSWATDTFHPEVHWRVLKASHYNSSV